MRRHVIVNLTSYIFSHLLANNIAEKISGVGKITTYCCFILIQKFFRFCEIENLAGNYKICAKILKVHLILHENKIDVSITISFLGVATCFCIVQVSFRFIS